MAYPNRADMSEEDIEARRLQRASQRKTRSIGIKYARASDGVVRPFPKAWSFPSVVAMTLSFL